MGVYPRVYLSVEGLPAGPGWIEVALVLLGVYLGWCFVFPYTACPWCGGRTKRHDGRGNYRLRRACRVCGGSPYRRLGARLIGRG